MSTSGSLALKVCGTGEVELASGILLCLVEGSLQLK